MVRANHDAKEAKLKFGRVGQAKAEMEQGHGWHTVQESEARLEGKDHALIKERVVALGKKGDTGQRETRTMKGNGSGTGLSQTSALPLTTSPGIPQTLIAPPTPALYAQPVPSTDHLKKGAADIGPVRLAENLRKEGQRKSMHVEDRAYQDNLNEQVFVKHQVVLCVCVCV